MFPGWDTYHLSRQPVLIFHYPYCKICLVWIFLNYWKATISSWSLFFSRLSKANSLSCSSQERCSSPLIISMASSRLACHQSTAEGQNQLPWPDGHTSLGATQGTCGFLAHLAFWVASMHCRLMSSLSSTTDAVQLQPRLALPDPIPT